MKKAITIGLIGLLVPLMAQAQYTVSKKSLTIDVNTGKSTFPIQEIIYTDGEDNFYTNNYLALSTQLKWDDISPYIYDSDILLDMINTNAAAIDDLVGGHTPIFIDEIYAVSNSAINGSNLWTAITDKNGSGLTNTYRVEKGEYLLPETLIIEGQTAQVIADPVIVPYWNYPGTSQDNFYETASKPTTPQANPSVTLSGDVIFTNTFNSFFQGFIFEDEVFSPFKDTQEEIDNPNYLIDCWTKGSVAWNQLSSLSFKRVFASGVTFGGTSSGWLGSMEESIILADGSLYKIEQGRTKAPVYQPGSKIDDCWITVPDAFQSDTSLATLGIRNSLINGDNAFNTDDIVSGLILRAEHSVFYGTAGSLWETLQAEAYFRYCSGISTNAPGSIFYCIDSMGNTVP